MDYYGQIKEILIPGYRDQQGKTHDHLEASFLAFEIEVFAYNNERRIDCPDLPNKILIIERDTLESASLMVGNWVKISVSVIKGYDEWNGYNKVFMNLCNTPCIAKTICPLELST